MLMMNRDKVSRVIDANLNRSKEGLRVCEDVMRFVLDRPQETQQYKQLRHQIERVRPLLEDKKGAITQRRDSESDVGRRDALVEFKRRSISDIFYANSQRSKESVRVLEEFLKLSSPRAASMCKKIRYDLYALERRATKILLNKMRG